MGGGKAKRERNQRDAGRGKAMDKRPGAQEKRAVREPAAEAARVGSQWAGSGLKPPTAAQLHLLSPSPGPLSISCSPRA